MFGIFPDSEPGEAAGSISLRPRSSDSVDIGIFVVRRAAGRGLGGSAWSLTLETLGSSSSYQVATAGTARTNWGMRRICEASGMRKSVELRSPFRTSTGWHEVAVYEIRLERS